LHYAKNLNKDKCLELLDEYKIWGYALTPVLFELGIGLYYNARNFEQLKMEYYSYVENGSNPTPESRTLMLKALYFTDESGQIISDFIKNWIMSDCAMTTRGIELAIEQYIGLPNIRFEKLETIKLLMRYPNFYHIKLVYLQLYAYLIASYDPKSETYEFLYNSLRYDRKKDPFLLSLYTNIKEDTFIENAQALKVFILEKYNKEMNIK